MTQSIPSYNPADTQSMAGNMRIFSDYLLNLIESCQPCVVQSVDYSTNTVIVQPAINISTTVGEYIQREVIKLTAWRFASGGFLIHYPIKQGDTGWMIAADKDTSLFKQEKKVADPNTNLKHQYSQGFFIPDKISGFNVSFDDNGRLVFQNESGSEKISIGDGDTKIVSTNLSINATNMTVTGETQFNGNVSISGTMHSANYDAHTHICSTAGSPSQPPNQ